MSRTTADYPGRRRVSVCTVPAGLRVELPPVAEDAPDLSPQAGVHQQVDVLAVLERLVQPAGTQVAGEQGGEEVSRRL